jgi:hypothetical protein
MEEEGCCEEGYRGEDEEVPEEVRFAINYKALESIKLEELEQYGKQGVVYIKQNPAFVIAWLKDHLANLFKEKETFMQGFVGDIVPVGFHMEFEEEKKQLRVKLNFTIDEEEEVELSLVGQLHRSLTDELGVDWSKEEGNDYWLSAVEKNLNDSLRLVA